MSVFFKGKRAGTISFSILLGVALTMLSLFGAVFLAVGIGNPVNKVMDSLITSNIFRADAGDYFVSHALLTAHGDEQAILISKGPEISSAVSAFLGNTLFEGFANEVSDVAFHYFTGKQQSTQTIDVKPKVQLGYIALTSLDPQFAQLKPELDSITPITLKPQTKGPNLRSIKGDADFVMMGWALFTLALLIGYLVFVGSRRIALRTLGIMFAAEGLFLTVIYVFGTMVISHQALRVTNTLVRAAIPIGANPLMDSVWNLGWIAMLVGAFLYSSSNIKLFTGEDYRPKKKIVRR